MSIDEILDEIRRLVLRRAAQGKTTADIDMAVGEFLTASGFESAMARPLQEMAKTEWTGARTISEHDRKVAANILKRVGSDYARVDGRIREGVRAVVQIALKRDEPKRILEPRLV